MSIEAANNWWGYNESTAVVGRIRDFRDLPELLQVRFEPFYRDNRTVLSGKKGLLFFPQTDALHVGSKCHAN